jgi:hypothetical protein
MQGDDSMIGRLARGMYLFIVAVMIAAYALSLTKSEPPPQNDQATWSWYV